jgi:riboflavin synthase
MFTGIITDVGSIRTSEQRGDLRLVISCSYDMDTVAIGASIACSGVCLTVVDKGDGWFAIDASAETVSRTAAGMWEQGTRLNLERALKVGDELGGHIVTGHVDGVGQIVASETIGDSWKVTVAAPSSLAAYIAAKGSITAPLSHSATLRAAVKGAGTRSGEVITSSMPGSMLSAMTR